MRAASVLLLLLAVVGLVSCALTGYTSLFDCEEVSYHPAYKKAPLAEVQTWFKNSRFQTAYLPFGKSNKDLCRIQENTPHRLQFPAINYLIYTRRYLGLTEPAFDCVETFKTDELAMAMYAEDSSNPTEKCRTSAVDKYARASIRIIRNNVDNKDGKDIFTVTQMALDSLEDTHLESRRRLIDARLKDYTVSAMGDETADSGKTYYVLVPTSYSKSTPDYFVAYPPPGFVLADWTSADLMWSFHHPNLVLSSKNIELTVVDRSKANVPLKVNKDALNDTFTLPGIGFKFDNPLVLHGRYIVSVTWDSATDEHFEIKYGFFYVNKDTKENDLNMVSPCDLPVPTYNPVDSIGHSLFDCRTLSASPLYNRPMKDLIGRYVSVYGSTSPSTPTSNINKETCSMGDDATPQSVQQQGLDYINFVRYYVGLPEITYNSTFQADCDAAAAWMPLNGAMTHRPREDMKDNPKLDYKCISDGVAQCLHESNLATCQASATVRDGIHAMMMDQGEKELAHRRFFMNPLLASTTVSAMRIGNDHGYVARVFHQNKEYEKLALPFYAFPPPGFALLDFIPNPSLNEWNSFHHSQLRSEDLVLKVTNSRGAVLDIDVDKESAMANNRPVPAVAWKFLRPPVVDKYTVSVSWKNIANYAYNYTFYLVARDTVVSIREPSQCNVKTFTTSWDCQTLSDHPAYKRDLKSLLTMVEEVSKPFSMPYLNFSLDQYGYSDGLYPGVNHRNNSNTMADYFNLLRAYLMLPAVENNAWVDGLQSYKQMSHQCLNEVSYIYFKTMKDDNPFCTKGGMCTGGKAGDGWSSECHILSIYTAIDGLPTGTPADALTLMKAMMSDPEENYFFRRSVMNIGLQKMTLQIGNFSSPSANKLAVLMNRIKQDYATTAQHFIAYPPPGFALKELQFGPFSFHHEDLSEPVSMKITNKAGEEVEYEANYSAINSYPTRGFFFTIKDLKIGERYRIRVTWVSNGRDFDIIYTYYYLDKITAPSMTPGCIYNPSFEASEDPDFSDTVVPQIQTTTMSAKNSAASVYFSLGFVFLMVLLS